MSDASSATHPEPRRHVTTEERRASLRSLLTEGRPLRFLEAHSPLSALLGETITVPGADHSSPSISYDGFWSSSLTDSTERGKPDIEVIDIAGRVPNIGEIFEVTSKPLIMDGDTGGLTEHFVINVRTLERIGVSAVIIEDKTGLKKNSLFGNDVAQQQASIEDFCEKLRAGTRAKLTPDFMIIARIESLILDQGMDDALKRAFAYVDAGADGIMIHSRKTSADEVMTFAAAFRARHSKVPLVCVPTSYAQTSLEELGAAGFDVVIYANHLLRASYLAMRSVAEEILHCGRTLEVEDRCLAIPEILDLIPGTR